MCVCVQNSAHQSIVPTGQFGHGKYQFCFLLCLSCEQARGTEHRSSVLDRQHLLGPQLNEEAQSRVHVATPPSLIFSAHVSVGVWCEHVHADGCVYLHKRDSHISLCHTAKMSTGSMCGMLFQGLLFRASACMPLESKTGSQLEKVLVMNTQARSNRMALAQAVPAMWIRCRYR